MANRARVEIQLPAQAHGKLSAVAASLSATAHVAFFALVLSHGDAWQYRVQAVRSGHAAAPIAARYVALAPVAPAAPTARKRPAPTPTKRVARRTTQLETPVPRIRLATEQPEIHQDDGPLAPPPLRPMDMKYARAPVSAPLSSEPMASAAAPRPGVQSPEDGQAAGAPRAPMFGRGDLRVAELVTAPGTACPTLRQPPGWKPRDGALIVAVGFVVDTQGVVEPSSLRIMQSIDGPREPNQYFSHIYVVGQNRTVDRELRKAGPTWDSLVTDEVVRHVKALAFRPATRDGHAERSTVLVSCQAS
jgi:hypothetical protein